MLLTNGILSKTVLKLWAVNGFRESLHSVSDSGQSIPTGIKHPAYRTGPTVLRNLSLGSCLGWTVGLALPKRCSLEKERQDPGSSGQQFSELLPQRPNLVSESQRHLPSCQHQESPVQPEGCLPILTPAYMASAQVAPARNWARSYWQSWSSGNSTYIWQISLCSSLVTYYPGHKLRKGLSTKRGGSSVINPDLISCPWHQLP